MKVEFKHMVMKNLLKIGFAVAALLLSTGSYANEGDFSFQVKRIDEKKIAFFTNIAQSVQLSIVAEDEEVLYNQEMKAASGSTKIYDLTSLRDGKYIFKLETDSRLAEYKVVILKGKAEIAEPLIIEKLKPTFSRVNEIVTLNLDSTPEGPVEIQVLDEDGEVLYTQSFAGGAKYAKKFNVSNVEIDSLTFVVKAKGQEFKEAVQIN